MLRRPPVPHVSGSATTLSVVDALRDFPSREPQSTHDQACTGNVGSQADRDRESWQVSKDNDSVEKAVFSLFGKKSAGGLVVASSRKSEVEQVVVYKYGRAPITYIAKTIKLTM